MVKKKPQTENKKPGIYNRILKWTGLTLLAILIILALLFRAPWKVIATLLIVLAACTVLPKSYRKWFWLSVAAIVIALIIWIFLPDDNEGWRPYTFDEELAALNAKYAIPDSENAATIYNDLLENYDANVFEPNFMDDDLDSLTRREPWSSNDCPELAEWLKSRQSTITILIEASKIENCRFPIVANIADLSKQTERLSAMRHWAFLLVRAGNNDMAEGRIEEGLDKYLCIKKIGDHIRQQSSMVEILVGIAVEALALARCKSFVVTADATEAHLSIVEKALAAIKHDWSSDWPIILDYEKLYAKNCFGRLYQVNKDGKVRFSRPPKSILLNESEIKLSFWRRKVWKLWIIWRWLAFPHNPQKFENLVENNFSEYYKMADPNYPWPSQSPELTIPGIGWLPSHFVDFAMPSESFYHNFHDIYLQTIAIRRGIRILVSLRRYRNKTNQWPQKLEDIKSLAPAEIFVDPINGNSFVYKITEENFTLYSKGKNNIDEDGIRKTTFDPNDIWKWLKNEEDDDVLIWPPAKSKTKKEKADSK